MTNPKPIRRRCGTCGHWVQASELCMCPIGVEVPDGIELRRIPVTKAHGRLCPRWAFVERGRK